MKTAEARNSGVVSGFELINETVRQSSCPHPTRSSSVQLVSIPPLSATRRSLAYPEHADIDPVDPNSPVEYNPDSHDPDQTLVKIPHSSLELTPYHRSRQRPGTPEPVSVQGSEEILSLNLQSHDSGGRSDQTGKCHLPPPISGYEGTETNHVIMVITCSLTPNVVFDSRLLSILF